MLKVILHGAENDSKYRDVAPLKLVREMLEIQICSNVR